ncbi:hypothetical protein QQ73_16135 [Candidatus Endoriftia persephone str. Guaymas]|nr:hypothetical protein [Candidatus Endoriftia persephone str. Guaymas]
MHLLVILPHGQSISFRRDSRNHTQIKYQLTGFIILIGLVHNYLSTFPAMVFKGFKQFPALRRITGLSGGQ